ncbi:MAG: AAA family ATPase, partial [Vicinamibacterales bacterium]
MQDIPTPELLHLLSEGTSFAVHRARLGPEGPLVIVKMPSRSADWSDAVARLETEYAITRGIDLPGALVASELLDTKRGPMLVFPDRGMAALDVRSPRPVPTDRLIPLARQIAGTLGGLHEAGIIHRDVNPSNLVVSPDLATVVLIDFCTAVRAEHLVRERPGDSVARGTLNYMAPEQSGRMSRVVDHRADLYSLGVTLYQIATGSQPFADTDAATVVHRHLTLVPPPPSELNPSVSRALSDAILRLVEKNPEDRFQTAADFLSAIADEGGTRTSTRLSIPDRLYGRAELLAELGQTVSVGLRGPSRLIRVTGPSGSGKSALISHLVKPAVASGAHFVQGKFDQLERARPYSAFLQAFDLLLRRLLAGSSEQVDAWRARLLDALSPSAQVLLDIMPRYQMLFGPQPPAPALGLSEAQIRMSLVFRRFVGSMARAESPLVIFLDDLQWSDSASRALIELLLTDPEIRNLTILTAYRGSEVGPSHAATLMFSALDAHAELLPPIEVGPLATADIADLVGESLGETPEAAGPLARIIDAKTAGNPFFIRQFLLAMARKGLVFHDAATGRWRWDNDRSMAERFADNVADLVAERILALPEATQQIVQLAACNGNSFETSILALAAGQTPLEIVRLLAPAVGSEVVLPAEDDGAGGFGRYVFQHDRVQQAASDTLPSDRRSLLHARIGAILLEKIPEAAGRLIEITDHLIAGRQHLDEPMRLHLRDLAFRAARQTMAANAYDAALRYLDAAEETLTGDGWQGAPRLAFEIALERAGVAYLQNRTAAAQGIATDLLGRSLDPLDQVRVLELEILIDTSQLAYRKALKTGLQALALLGETLPLDPGVPRVLGELLLTKARLARCSDDDILRFPRMTDPRKLAAMRVLVLLGPPAYFSSPNLLPLIALRIVRLSVRHGNAQESAFGYVTYGMLHCALLGAPRRGLAYGELARRAAIDLGAQHIEGRVLMVLGGFIQGWTAPLARTLPVFLEGADKAISAGDLEYHGYCRYAHASYALMAGQPLARVSDYLEQHLTAVTDSRHEKTRRIITMARASVGRMRGLTNDSFANAFDDAENFQLWTEQADATSLAYFHKYKLLEALMAGDYIEVLFRARRMTDNLNGILGMPYQPFYQFYEALALIELARRAAPFRRLAMRVRAVHLTRRIERWARWAPDNFAHRADLLRAELAFDAGRMDRAISRFDLAIGKARSVGALNDVGMFLERAARFYLALGATDLAEVHVDAASRAHGVWGGQAWAAALSARYPDLVHHQSAYTIRTAAATASAAGAIDGNAMIRVATAITQRVSLEEMVVEVVQAIVVHAGAQRGALMLVDAGELRLAAEVGVNGEVRMIRGRNAVDCHDLPQRIVNYVWHSAEPVVLDDASVDETFGTDPYVVSAQPHSVLCVPLITKGTTIGLAYLENARVRGAFTTERCRTVEVLGAQAAVSLENARLFDKLRAALERQVELTSAHARFVPHTFLEMLGRPSIADVRLGDHVRGEASILFLDIREFTQRIEDLGPDDAIKFINAFLLRVEPAVQASGGFVDSYVGDAVMAVFDRGPGAAIDAAIAIVRALRAWTSTDEGNGAAPVRVGIGIATGELTFGTIGAANRLKCGVIGDTVNLASRLEGLTKHYGLDLLITEETHRALPDASHYQIREVDLITVAGRKTPVRLYEVFDADPEPLCVQKARTAVDIA